MSVKISYCHPDLKKDFWFGHKSEVLVPLGIEVLDYRAEKKGESCICSDGMDIYTANYDGSGSVRNLIVTDHRPEIERIYGKPADQITAPEGYEFTGAFRAVKEGETFLPAPRSIQQQAIVASIHDERAINTRLILRKIETDPLSGLSQKYADRLVQNVWTATAEELSKQPEQLSLPLTPKGYTAADILARYGQNVLDVFGYREGTLRDYPGFVYSGELTNVNPGEWYVYAGQVRKYENLNRSVFSSLTLIPTTPPEPRIVTFTLTALEDFEDGEQAYIQDDLGGFMTAAGAPAGATLYSRSEVL